MVQHKLLIKISEPPLTIAERDIITFSHPLLPDDDFTPLFPMRMRAPPSYRQNSLEQDERVAIKLDSIRKTWYSDDIIAWKCKSVNGFDGELNPFPQVDASPDHRPVTTFRKPRHPRNVITMAGEPYPIHLPCRKQVKAVVV